MKVYETLWQVACIPVTATHGLRHRNSARHPAMLWTHKDGQRRAQCSKARPHCSSALHACNTVLQAVQQGYWQATFASLTAIESLPCEFKPPHLRPTWSHADSVCQWRLVRWVNKLPWLYILCVSCIACRPCRCYLKVCLPFRSVWPFWGFSSSSRIITDSRT